MDRRSQVTPDEVWALAQSRGEHLRSIAREDALFVDDDLVTYDQPIQIVVRRDDLFSLDDTDAWQPFLEPRPTWLHLNLLLTPGAEKILTVRRSRARMSAADERMFP